MAETYTVKKGDTLSGIGKSLGVDYKKITGYKSGDPNIINVGEVLTIPEVTQAPKPTLESIQAGISDVAASIPGVRADVKALVEVDEGQAPPIDSNAGDVLADGSNIQAKLDADQRAIDDAIAAAKKDAEDKANAVATAKTGVFASLKDVKDIEPLDTKQLMIDTLAQWGYTPESYEKVQGWSAELATLSKQAVDLETQKQAAMGVSEQAGMPMTYIRGEQALIERQYNSKIAAKAAQGAIVSMQIEMERGLWDEARTTANMIVSAATYDQQQIVADLKWSYEANIDLYNMASGEEKDAWNKHMLLETNELNKQQSEWNTKLALNQRAAEAGISLGWNSEYMASHTVEELNTEYAERVSAQIQADKLAAGDVEGITPEEYKSGMLADKTDGMTYEQAVSSYGSVVSLDYIDRVYKEGKYLLQEFEIEEKEEEQEALAEWQTDYDKWTAKSDEQLKKEGVRKFEFVNDKRDREVRFTKKAWYKDKMDEEILFSYLK